LFLETEIAASWDAHPSGNSQRVKTHVEATTIGACQTSLPEVVYKNDVTI